MDKKIIFTVVEENNILLGKNNAKYECSIFDDKMILVNLKDSSDVSTLFYSYIDVVKFVIYKNKICLIVFYEDDAFIISMSDKEWANENTIYLLKQINRYGAILRPGLYYEVIYNKKSIRENKKKFEINNPQELVSQMEELMDEPDFEENYNKKDLAVGYSIDTYYNSSMNDEQKELALDAIIDYMESLNDDLRYSNLILYYICKRIAVIAKDKIEDIINRGLTIAKKYIEKHNNVSDLIYYYSYLETICFYDDKCYDKYIKEYADEVVNGLKALLKDNDNLYIYKDLSSFCEKYRDYNIENKNINRACELNEDIVFCNEKIVEHNPCWRNKFKLSLVYVVETNFCLDVKEDFLSAKEYALKKETLYKEILNTIKIVEDINSIHLLRSIKCIKEDREEILEGLSETYYELALIGIEYENYYDLNKYMNLYFDLEIYLLDHSNYYENKEKATINILGKVNLLIRQFVGNAYDNLDDVRNVVIKFGKFVEKKNKQYDNLQTNIEYLHAIYYYEQFIYIVADDEPDLEVDYQKTKNLLLMRKVSKKIITMDKDYSEAYDALIYSSFMIFIRTSETDKETATECAKTIVENFNNLSEFLQGLEDYAEMKKTCEDYLK